MTAGEQPGNPTPAADGAVAPSADAEAAAPDDTLALRREIEQTRAELGDTVEQLAAKADVKGRARAKAAALTGRVKSTAAASRARVADRAGSARGQLAAKRAAARDKTVALRGTGKSQLQARVAPVWEAAPEPARNAVAKGASAARQRRVPLAAALAALIACYLAARRWRKR